MTTVYEAESDTPAGDRVCALVSLATTQDRSISADDCVLDLVLAAATLVAIMERNGIGEGLMTGKPETDRAIHAIREMAAEWNGEAPEVPS